MPFSLRALRASVCQKYRTVFLFAAWVSWKIDGMRNIFIRRQFHVQEVFVALTYRKYSADRLITIWPILFNISQQDGHRRKHQGVPQFNNNCSSGSQYRHLVNEAERHTMKERRECHCSSKLYETKPIFGLEMSVSGCKSNDREIKNN